jgi:L-amino acid N-acyltransferase YncA
VIVRPATPADGPAMTDLLNQIIAIGGTTAHQSPRTEQLVRDTDLDGPDVISSVVAENQGRIVGWQSLSNYHDDVHIGTFVQPGLQARGVGGALFALTCDKAREAGVKTITAYIRADNLPGLAYYARIGFVDYESNPDFALNDGRIVGRAHRRFDL